MLGLDAMDEAQTGVARGRGALVVVATMSVRRSGR